MTIQANGPTRRDIVRAAGLGLGAALTGGAAFAEPAAVSGGGDGLWSGDYGAKKGDVSLYLYRKRLAAPKPGDKPLPVLFLVHGSSISALSELRPHGARRRRIFADERLRPRSASTSGPWTMRAMAARRAPTAIPTSPAASRI